MRSAPLPSSAAAGKRKGAVWLDICVILAVLGIMGGLARVGWQRAQKPDSDRKAHPSSQKTDKETAPQPAGGGG